jgi:hypothetical protein
MVERFEHAHKSDANYFTTTKGYKVPVVGGVLLHMLTHYGLHRAGLPYVPAHCVGDDFEKATYRKIDAVRFVA